MGGRALAVNEKKLPNMDEMLCLKWNDFQDNIKTAFRNLKEDNDFADVTLACDDGNQIDAHKVILAASSPFFQNLLKRNKHSHPLIYMRGMKSEDLIAIVDFLYCGEANVLQENLDSFLAIAEDLKLKGLMGQNNDRKDVIHDGQANKSLQMKTQPFQIESKPVFKQGISYPERRMAVPNFCSDFAELDLKVKSMMEKSQNMVSNGTNGKMATANICKICGKEGHPKTIRDHIEANHLDGVSLPCNICEKTFRSRMSLRKHRCILLL